MNSGAWRATVHEAAKSRPELTDHSHKKCIGLAKTGFFLFFWFFHNIVWKNSNELFWPTQYIFKTQTDMNSYHGNAKARASFT